MNPRNALRAGSFAFWWVFLSAGKKKFHTHNAKNIAKPQLGSWAVSSEMTVINKIVVIIAEAVYDIVPDV